MFNPFVPTLWRLARGKFLELGSRARVMGILNVTPDSFSDGGEFTCLKSSYARAQEMVSQGADIIDVGGESTRPGADPVSEGEEQNRVIPVIEQLARLDGVLISVDTYRSTTAELAIRAGAHIINDVYGGQKDQAILNVAASTGAGLCLMHTGRDRKIEADILQDQTVFLSESLELARNAGVNDEQIVLDPGFGFAKDVADNLLLLSHLETLHALNRPLLIGTSRKRFLGAVCGGEANQRDAATAATSVIARLKGGAIFRVHDIKTNMDALAMTDAVIEAAGSGSVNEHDNLSN